MILTSPVRRVSRTIGVALLCVVLLSGCFKVDVDLSVYEDNTVSGSMTIAVSKQFTRAKDIIEQMGDSIQTSDQVKVEPYQDDEHVGFTVKYDRVPLEEFNRVGQAGQATGTAGPGLRREGDFFILGDPAAQPSETSRTMPIQPIYKYTVTFPGSVVDSNGTVEGNSVSWNDMSAVPYAKANAKGSLLVPILIGIGVLVVIAAIAAVVFLVLRNRQRAKQTALTAAPNPWSSAPSAGSFVQPQQWNQGQQGSPSAFRQGSPSAFQGSPSAFQQGGQPPYQANQSYQGGQSVFDQPDQGGQPPAGGDSPWSRP